MATISVETVIDVPAHRVWEVVADVGAVHRRLLPGRVAATRIEGDVRILPHAVADVVRGRVERGIQEIKETLESNRAEQ